MDSVLILIVANLTVTSAMFGVIWIVQLVHYPMFEGLEAASFQRWHTFHSNRITYVVAPLMVGELGLSGLLAWRMRESFSIVSFSITVGIWLATFFWSVPTHERLGQLGDGGRNHDIRQLIATNWPRTALYTAKTALLISLFLESVIQCIKIV